jgi:hypothetical protein
MGLPFHGFHLVLSPVPSEHEQNSPTSLKRGEGCLGRGTRLAIDITAHIPRKRGGAEGYVVPYRPTFLRRGEGQEVGNVCGLRSWSWSLMNPRSTVIEVDLAFKLRSTPQRLYSIIPSFSTIIKLKVVSFY